MPAKSKAKTRKSKDPFAELKRKLKERDTELKEAREQQTATAEILKVISSSPTNIQPVFDAILESATRLCDAHMANLGLYDGETYQVVAQRGGSAEYAKWIVDRGSYKPPLVGAIGRMVAERQCVHIPDIRDSAGYRDRSNPNTVALVELARARTYFAAPMLKEGCIIGGVAIYRSDVRPFTQKQIDLVSTFANQAVIAIENVRLFKELHARNAEVTESLEQQTATAEILKVISSSPTDTQPVFDAIVKSAARLFDGMAIGLRLVKGDHTEVVATSQGSLEAPLPMRQENVPSQRAILRGEAVHVHDISLEGWLGDEYKLRAERRGIRAMISVPMLRERIAIGAINVGRKMPGPFTDKQIALLTTFADQAMIAIDNVRLFKELQARNAEVTESLEQQTATAEILKVISRSPTDIQPVFDAILENATRLCDANFADLSLYEGDTRLPVAQRGGSAEYAKWLMNRGLYRPVASGSVARVMAEARPIQIADLMDSSGYRDRTSPGFVALVELGGARTFLVVPMLKGGRVVGSITIYRPEVRPFSQKQIDLVSTFANQAVIAIENVRLFNEVKARSEELARSVEEMRALGEVGQAVSSTLDLQTVLVTVITHAVELSKADAGGTIYEFDETTEVFEPRANYGVSDAYVMALREARLRLGETAVGMCVVHRGPYQITDLEKSEDNRIRDLLLREGIRSVLAVPLLREDQVIGALVIRRKVSGEFSHSLVTLLQTFADQSVLAIENARLFKQVQSASDELKVASQHKSEFLANMSHELRTPLNAVIGFSEVLQQRMFGELNDKQVEYIDYIHTSGSHLLSLINDILDLSKVEAGHMELDLTAFNVPMAIDNALTLVKERATRHGLLLECTFDAAVGDIHADERKFKQILLNLLSNAVKFTPEGGRITVAAQPVNGAVEVSVTDTGIGIAPKDCEAVFEEFRQVGRNADGKAEGTGLGLALTRKFIELHGGKIWLTSTLGKGSTFAFTLPVGQPAEAPPEIAPRN